MELGLIEIVFAVHTMYLACATEYTNTWGPYIELLEYKYTT